MHHYSNEDLFSDQQQQSLLDDLEMRCQTNVAVLREAATVRATAQVTLRAANVCERDQVLTTMQTSELTATTMSGIAPQPLMVGSVFYLQFDRTALDVTPALAVCDRCTMLSDTSFELRFRFTQAIAFDAQ